MSFIPGTPIYPHDVLGLELASGSFTAGVLKLTMVNGATVSIPIALGPSDIAGALGGAGTAGQVVGTDGTTPQWVNITNTGVLVNWIIANTLIATLPAGAMIVGLTVTETSGVPVTFFLGTSSGAQDVLGPVALAANQMIPISPLSLNAWAWTAAQPLFVGSSSWGGAALSVKLVYA